MSRGEISKDIAVGDHFLIECLSDINACVKRPLQQTLRIKFTTFAVSTNYLIFGATSGGIYVFNRSNCDFMKLIPSKEGAILKLLICPDEKYILLATSKGFLVLVENCFSASGKIRYQQFNEHEGNTITDVVWHYNEIYSGDNKGKVTVISLSSLLSKAIFQTPTATLMHLDAPVVQLDAFGKFLLVSTKTKTFLCDTDTEQYRQIGKKLRDGDFGACFLCASPTRNRLGAAHVIRERDKGRFKILKEDESFSGASGHENARIFCTRPGFRLWEASFGASVVCTYQFKTALQENQTESVCIDGDVNGHLKTRKMLLHNFDNFGPLRVAIDRFLITHCNNNLVVFDSQAVHLLFIYEMRDMKEIRIVQNYIYLWNKKDVRVIALMDLEFLLLKSLSSKQYTFCMEICVKFNDRVLQLLAANDRLRALHILKDKCKDSKNLSQIFELIERYNHNPTTQSSSQIVTVENGHIEEPSCSYNSVQKPPPSRLKVKSAKYVNGTRNSRSPSPSASPTRVKKKTKSPSPAAVPPRLPPPQDAHYVNNILYKQYQVNQLYDSIETPQLTELLASRENLDDIVRLFDTFIADNNGDEGDPRLRRWCYAQFLKYVNNQREIVRTLDKDSMALKYIFNAFKHTSLSDDSQCTCKFPLPLPAEAEHEYFQLAKDVYYKLSSGDREQLLASLPALWRLKVAETKEPLTLLMQLGGTALLREHAEKFTYDQWNDCAQLLVKLKRGHCLNCDRVLKEPLNMLTWKDFGLLALKSLGGLETTKMLKKYARFIPNSELGYEFYQSCLFSAVSRENGKSCDFVSNVLTSKRLENQFEDGLKQYLSQKYLGINDGAGVDGEKCTDGKNRCDLCHLQVRNPVLDVSTRLSCGHLFHKLCLDSNNGVCRTCLQARVPV